jgi:hypothetical protein
VSVWKAEIRRRLQNLQLEQTREAAIVAELARYLDDYYAESLADGATESDAGCFWPRLARQSDWRLPSGWRISSKRCSFRSSRPTRSRSPLRQRSCSVWRCWLAGFQRVGRQRLTR